MKRLIEQLERVPYDAVIFADKGTTRTIPVGRLCADAVSRLRRSTSRENDRG